MKTNLKENTVITIGGPTASGKSGFALRLAEEFNGVIVNFDSIQLYDGLHILTAQPPKEDLDRCEHRLYSVLKPEEAAFSAASWRDLALKEIEDILSQGKLPILVGGTGFYQKALIEGLSPIPEHNPKTREMLRQKQKELGNPEFYNEFAKLDQATAKNLDPFNTQRVIRAWEVLIDTGKPLSEWHKAPLIGPPAHLNFYNINILPDRDKLYANCDLRFKLMLEHGALEEVKEFKAKYENQELALNKALGYRELCDYLDGKTSLDEAREKSQQITRNYAKRQTTWFKNQVKADITINKPKEEVELLINKLTK